MEHRPLFARMKEMKEAELGVLMAGGRAPSADSLAGSVNLVSKSAFDRASGRHLSGSVGVTWRATDRRDEPRPTRPPTC